MMSEQEKKSLRQLLAAADQRRQDSPAWLAEYQSQEKEEAQAMAERLRDMGQDDLAQQLEERLNLNEKPKRYALVDVDRFVEAYSEYDMTTERAIEEVLKASIVETEAEAPLEHVTMFRVLGSDLIWHYVVAENGREACKKVKEQYGSDTDDVDEYSYVTIY